MVRRSGLGRGLGALIPSDGREAGPAELLELPLGSIVANPNQPRTSVDEQALTELAESISSLGVLQPILVRPLDSGQYELIAGERRWRAARRAGLDTIPAVVREVDEMASVAQALVENLQRQDLTALEEAAAFLQLIEDFGLGHDEVARRVGKSRSAVSNTVRLLQLPPSIQHLLSAGRLTAGHARALMGTPDRSLQESLARSAVAEGWTVRAVEDAVRTAARSGGPADPAVERRPEGRPNLRPPGLLELEQLLSDHLATRVQVSMGGRRGKVVIEFATLDDLERIYRIIAEPDTDE